MKLNHPAIEGPWSQRALNAFLTRYGHGWPDDKPLAMRQKLWRLHCICGFAVFGPGYACYTTFPVMVAAWSGFYNVVGDLNGSPRGEVCRMAANQSRRWS